MKIRVEIELEVQPFTRGQLEEVGFDGEEAEPDFEEIDAHGIGEGIAGLFFEGSDAATEAVAGSNIFVTIGSADLIRAVKAEA